MITSPSEALSSAIASLQGLLSKHCPDTFSYRIAERALDLAFNCPCALRAAPEQELLTEAECLIRRQVLAGLIPKTAVAPLPVLSTAEQIACPRHLGWRRKMRPRVAEQFAQSECGLATEERSGASHVVVR